MSYTHFTQDERICLGECIAKAMSIRSIARVLGRSPSTISRELKRNSSRKGYGARHAQCLAQMRWRKPKRSCLQMCPEKRTYVIEKLLIYWTPEQIAHTWMKDHPGSKISISTIYRHVKRGWLPGISKKQHLRRRSKHKVHRNANYRTIHPDRIIPQWPEEIRQRTRIGDWEGDTINGARGKGAAVTLVDRKSGLICGRVLHTKDAATTRQAIEDALHGLPVCSLSLDNGPEFAEFRLLEQHLNAPIYFAEPRKPWQRGCNENANDLLRFFFPKGCDFTLVSQQDFDRVLFLINSRPRKRLDWVAPLDFFSVALA